MSNSTLYIQAKTGDSNVNYTAAQFRALTAAQFPLPGVIPSTSSFSDLAVVPRQAGQNMSVDVLAGAAIVPCTSIGNGGSYHTVETATVNVSLPAAPGSGKLVHRIVQRVFDPQNDASVSTYSSGPFCVSGSSTAGTLPALPNNCVELAQVTVTAGTAAITAGMIADVRAPALTPGQLFGSPTTSSANTNSAADAGTELHVQNSPVVRIAVPAFVRVEYSMTVAATDTTTYNIEGKIRRATGTDGPGDTGGTYLTSAFTPMAGTTSKQMTNANWYTERLTAGTYTYGLSVQPNGGRGWKKGDVTPSWMSVSFVGLG